MKLTKFEDFYIAIQLVGASKTVAKLTKELESGQLDANVNDLVYGEEGLYLVTEEGLLTRVILHIVDVNIKGGYFGKKARGLVKGGMYNDPTLLYKIHKYHLVNCGTLQQARRQGWRDKYKMSQRQDGFFYYRFISDKTIFKENKSQKLSVCGNCLREIRSLNKSKKQFTKATFTPKLFFSNEFQSSWLKSNGNNEFAKDSVPNKYHRDWDKISSTFKTKINYRCQGENCPQPNLYKTELRKFLHCHHKNMDKSNNNFSNLIALCISCHAEQPNHGHLKGSREYKEYSAILNQ